MSQSSVCVSEVGDVSTIPFTQWRDYRMYAEIAWHYIAYISHCICDVLYSILKQTAEPVMLNTRPLALLMNDAAKVILYFIPQSFVLHL